VNNGYILGFKWFKHINQPAVSKNGSTGSDAFYKYAQLFYTGVGTYTHADDAESETFVALNDDMKLGAK